MWFTTARLVNPIQIDRSYCISYLPLELITQSGEEHAFLAVAVALACVGLESSFVSWAYSTMNTMDNVSSKTSKTSTTSNSPRTFEGFRTSESRIAPPDELSSTWKRVVSSIAAMVLASCLLPPNWIELSGRTSSIKWLDRKLECLFVNQYQKYLIMLIISTQRIIFFAWKYCNEYISLNLSLVAN